MIGRNVKLYDMVVSFLRTLFLRKRNIHYCTLRWEQRFFLFSPFVADWVGLWLDWSIAVIVPDFFQSGVVTGLKFCCDCARLFSKWGCDWTEVLLWLCQTFFKVGFWLNWSIAMIVPDFFQSGVVTGLKYCCDCARLFSKWGCDWTEVLLWLCQTFFKVGLWLNWSIAVIVPDFFQSGVVTGLKYCYDCARLFSKWGCDWTEVLLWLCQTFFKVGLWLDWSIAMIVPDFFQSGVVIELKYCCDCARLFSKWGCDWTEVLLWLCQTFFKVGLWLDWSVAVIVLDFCQASMASTTV